MNIIHKALKNYTQPYSYQIAFSLVVSPFFLSLGKSFGASSTLLVLVVAGTLLLLDESPITVDILLYTSTGGVLFPVEDGAGGAGSSSDR